MVNYSPRGLAISTRSRPNFAPAGDTRKEHHEALEPMDCRPVRRGPGPRLAHTPPRHAHRPQGGYAYPGIVQGGAQQQAGPDAGAQQGQYYDADYKVVDDDENNKK